MKKTIRLICWGFITAASAVFAAPAPGTVRWVYGVGSAIDTSPAVGPDGTIYVGTDLGVCAVTNGISFGTNKWTFATERPVYSAPTVGFDGSIYFSSGTVYALNPDGSQKWSYPLVFQWTVFSSPAIGLDGTVYVCGEGKLYAFTAGGSKKWAYNIYGNDRFSPIIAPGGTVYVGNDFGSTLFAVNPDGTLKWSLLLLTGYSTGTCAALAQGGVVYVTGGDLFAVGAEGSKVWSTSGGDFGLASPAIASDGTIYLATYPSKSLTTVTPGGERGWQTLSESSAPDSPPPTVPAIDSGGTAYYCVSNGLFAISPQGQVLWEVQGGNPRPGFYPAKTSPVIGPDGTVYAAFGTTIYAVAAGTNGPANSPWPMYRQNARHTGKVEKPVLKPPQKRSDANFEFQLYPQQFGLTYTVESSSNLYNWTSLTSFVANTLPTDVVDLTASNAPARFYRAFSLP